VKPEEMGYESVPHLQMKDMVIMSIFWVVGSIGCCQNLSFI